MNRRRLLARAGPAALLLLGSVTASAAYGPLLSTRRAVYGTVLAAQTERRAQAVRPVPRRGQAGVNARLMERLLRMPPRDRQRFLRENEGFRQLPRGERQRILHRIERLSRLPPEQQRRVLERFRLFGELPPREQSRARAVYRQWQQIPPPRRRELLDEFDGLRDAEPEDRRKRFESREFKDSFSERERDILKELTDLLPEGGANPEAKP